MKPKERSKKASEEVHKILKKYKCIISAQIIVRQSGNFPQIFIIPQEENN